MRALRSHLAILLLLCFTRVLLPDAWILALHTHQHTTEEPTQLAGAPKAKALLTAKHQHCAVDHFYDVPFQLAAALEFTALISYSAPSSTPHISVWLTTTQPTADLRGPPSLS